MPCTAASEQFMICDPAAAPKVYIIFHTKGSKNFSSKKPYSKHSQNNSFCVSRDNFLQEEV